MIPEINTLLYATDLQPGSRPAFRHAVRVARAHDARIVFMSAIEPRQQRVLKRLKNSIPDSDVDQMDVEGTEAVKLRMRERLNRFLEDEQVALEPEQIEMVLVENSQPDQAILHTADKHQADMIVMGFHQERQLSQLFLGVTANRVIKASPVPVLVVPLP